MDKIHNTEAWKVLNSIIDNKVASIQHRIAVVMRMCKDNAEPVNYQRSDIVSTRVSYDEGGSQDFVMNISLRDLEWMCESMQEIKKLKEEIGELQRFKLVLANDWDFTKGDDTMKREIYGDRKFEGVEDGYYPDKES